MSTDTVLRIFMGLCGLFVAGALAHSLFNGRITLAGRKVLRSSEAPAYWKTVGINVLLVLTFALAIWVPERIRTPVFFIGVVISFLLQAHVSGLVGRFNGTFWSRARGDAGFRNRMIAYWAMLAMFAALLAAGLYFGP